MSPQRIQMTRQHPWRTEHPDAVIVARPSKWGNPYRVVKSGHHWGVRPLGYADIAQGTEAPTKTEAAAIAVRWYAASIALRLGEIESELLGKDLACWCPLDQPCHADVLLEIANAEDAL